MIEFKEHFKKPSIVLNGIEYILPVFQWNLVKFIYDKRQVSYADLAEKFPLTRASVANYLLLAKRKIKDLPIKSVYGWGYQWTDPRISSFS